MPKGSPELTAARKDEIISACEQLYQTMSFKDITLKDISSVTSFTRTSIYNYFQTKEEIFLALYEREYDRWNEDLEKISSASRSLTREQVAVLSGKVGTGYSEFHIYLLSIHVWDLSIFSSD